MMTIKSAMRLAALMGGFLLGQIASAQAQGFSGTLGPGMFYGNPNGVEAKPQGALIGAMLDRALSPTSLGVIVRTAPSSYAVQSLPLPLNLGGTGSVLAPSQGGIHYSTALATAILPAPLGGNLPLLSGLAAPAWGNIAYLTTAISGGVPYFPSGSQMASSAQLAANAPMIGGGAGVAPSTVPAGVNGQLFLGVTGGAPAFVAMSGDAAIANSGVVTIQPNAVTNAKAAQMAAFTFKGNATGALANATDFTIAGLTNKAAPTGADLLVLSDTAAAGATKQATITAIIGAVTSGVSSIAGNTGAFTLSTGIINSTNDIRADIATNSNAWSATANKIIDAARINGAGAPVALTDAATIATDMATGINFTVTLGGNRTLGAPTNTQTGRTGCYFITQDGAGTRTLAYNAVWKFSGGTAPVLTTTIGAIDRLCYIVLDSTHIHATLGNDIK